LNYTASPVFKELTRKVELLPSNYFTDARRCQ
jgi:hypothetical protein